MTAFNYDAGWAGRWDDMKQYGPMSRHVRRYIKKLMRPLQFESVLDVGCGQGALLGDVVAEFRDIEPHGVDISASAIELALRRVPHGQFAVLNIEREHTECSYDLIICSEVLEHIDDDDAAIRNLRRMCRRYLLVSTLQGRMRRFEPEQVGHVRNYARGELTAKLRNAGFEIVKAVEWGFPLYSPLYRNLLEITGSRGTTGTFGYGRRLLSATLYYLFFLNLPVWGDEIFVLARVPS